MLQPEVERVAAAGSGVLAQGDAAAGGVDRGTERTGVGSGGGHQGPGHIPGHRPADKTALLEAAIEFEVIGVFRDQRDIIGRGQSGDAGAAGVIPAAVAADIVAAAVAKGALKLCDRQIEERHNIAIAEIGDDTGAGLRDALGR